MLIPEQPDFRIELYPQQNVFLLEENIPLSWIWLLTVMISQHSRGKMCIQYSEIIEELVLRSQLKQTVVNRNFMVLWPENVSVIYHFKYTRGTD